jgi:hypothetical protein
LNRNFCKRLSTHAASRRDSKARDVNFLRNVSLIPEFCPVFIIPQTGTLLALPGRIPKFAMASYLQNLLKAHFCKMRNVATTQKLYFVLCLIEITKKSLKLLGYIQKWTYGDAQPEFIGRIKL